MDVVDSVLAIVMRLGTDTHAHAVMHDAHSGLRRVVPRLGHGHRHESRCDRRVMAVHCQAVTGGFTHAMQ